MDYGMQIDAMHKWFSSPLSLPPASATNTHYGTTLLGTCESCAPALDMNLIVQNRASNTLHVSCDISLRTLPKILDTAKGIKALTKFLIATQAGAFWRTGILGYYRHPPVIPC